MARNSPIPLRLPAPAFPIVLCEGEIEDAKAAIAWFRSEAPEELQTHASDLLPPEDLALVSRWLIGAEPADRPHQRGRLELLAGMVCDWCGRPVHPGALVVWGWSNDAPMCVAKDGELQLGIRRGA